MVTNNDTVKDPNWSIIAACTNKGGIGLNGDLPWRLPRDMKYFAYVTSRLDALRYNGIDARRQNVVIMGRLTWQSIPKKFRPLTNRINIVVSSTLATVHKDVHVAASLDEAILLIKTTLKEAVADVFFIGGSRIYTDVHTHHLDMISTIHITRIGADVECDAFMPILPYVGFEPYSVSPTQSHNQLPYDVVVYINTKSGIFKTIHDAHNSAIVKANQLYPFGKLFEPIPTSVIKCSPSVHVRAHEEFQYLDLIYEVITHGEVVCNRTGVDAKTLFGKVMSFDLRQAFPLLTTKLVFWKGVVEELLWFIKGDTNANHLTNIGVKIWERNGSREFLDSLGFVDREAGDLGPVYGFQWRHFGAEYKDMHADYTGGGVDQLQKCIDLIKTNPTDRRIIMTAWNPSALDKMALPPCHMFCQFYVSSGELSCCMYQRSCDLGLGVPFNVASYALLTIMLAQVCGLKPGAFKHFLGNAHVYVNHIDALKEQLTRIPRPFPILNVKRQHQSIDDFESSDFELIGYAPYPKIYMEMAV